MSAHDLLLPNSAMAQVFQEIESNLVAIERRLSWKSVTHSVSGGQTTNYGNNSGFVNLLSLTVDPGRWVIFSNLSMALSSFNTAVWPAGGFMQSHLQAVGPEGTTANDAFLSVPWRERLSGMTNVVSLVSAGPITATLSMTAGYGPTTPGFGSFNSPSSTLIAFPA